VSDLLGSAAALVERGVPMDSPEFYDAAMTGAGEPAMLELEHSPWLPIYEEAARWIPTSANVVDLGCGTGRFLACVGRTSHRGRRHGVDFSPAAIKEARRYARATFEVADLREWRPDEPATFTCIEVLEHLADDLDLVARIPTGSQFIFSVPSYLSASHVRCFPSLRDVFGRFGHLVEIRRWSLIRFTETNVVHVLDSTRRTGAW
jgi:SAM-dependent methyltransferase